MSDQDNNSVVRIDALPNRRVARIKSYFADLGMLASMPVSVLDAVIPLAVQGQLAYGIIGRAFAPEHLATVFARVLGLLGMPRYVVFNVYDIVQMYWQRHPDYEAYHYVDADCVLLWGGYDEMENKSLEQMVEEFLMRRRLARRTTIVLLRRGVYSSLDSYLETNAHVVIDLSEHTIDERMTERRNF